MDFSVPILIGVVLLGAACAAGGFLRKNRGLLMLAGLLVAAAAGFLFCNLVLA